MLLSLCGSALSHGHVVTVMTLSCAKGDRFSGLKEINTKFRVANKSTRPQIVSEIIVIIIEVYQVSACPFILFSVSQARPHV